MSLRHPFVELAEFPEHTVTASTVLWRITGAGHAATPWWFSNSGDGRFDLNRHSGRGTCYLADSPVGALLETIWRDAVPTGAPGVFPPIAPSEVAALRAVKVEVPGDHRCADVTGDGGTQLHTSFGITDAIGTCDGYQRPQEWASAWDSHSFGGVAYRLAHGTGLLGWALFGAEGTRALAGVSTHALDDTFLGDHDVHVVTPPSIVELDVIDNEAAAIASLTSDWKASG